MKSSPTLSPTYLVQYLLKEYRINHSTEQVQLINSITIGTNGITTINRVVVSPIRILDRVNLVATLPHTFIMLSRSSRSHVPRHIIKQHIFYLRYTNTQASPPLPFRSAMIYSLGILSAATPVSFNRPNPLCTA